MSTQQLDRLKAQFRKYPFNPAVTEAELRALADRMAEVFPVPQGVSVTASDLGGVPAERLCASPDGPVTLYFHGGGYVTGSPRSHRHLGGLLAAETGGTVWMLDYRLAPEHPFPAATDDALAAYSVLSEGQAVALAGDSAGGGLALVTAIRARDAGLRRPACVVGISPWVNALTDSASYDLLAAVDPNLSRDISDWHATRYIGDADPRDPLISPVRADLAGLPPVLIQVGDNEVFFGDAAHMHQRLVAAGVAARFRAWDGMFHVWHIYWPRLDEGRAGVVEAAEFIRAHA